MTRVSDDDRGEFGRLLRSRRGKRRLIDIAADTGVSRHTLMRWESGQIGNPSPQQLDAVLQALDIPREDAYRALGRLPSDSAPARFDDPDVQAIWDLGERRNWPEDLRLQMIDLWRGRQLRESEDDLDRPVTDEDLAVGRRLLAGGPEVGVDEAAARGDRNDVTGVA